MKKTILILFVFSYCSVLAQNKDSVVVERDTTKKFAKNTMYVDFLSNSWGLLGGWGGLPYSLNYDRIIFKKDLFKIFGRAGIAIYPVGYSHFYGQYTNIYAYAFMYAAETGFLYGNKHNIEVSISASIIFEEYKKNIFMIYDNYWSFDPRIGYRYQQPDGGLFIRVGFTGIIILFAPIPVLSCGYTFKSKK